MRSPKNAREKMENAPEARVVAIPPRMQKRFGKGKMLIPGPLDLDAMIRKVPRGKLVTLGEVREKLARAAGAKVTCPMVAGILLRVIAEAAEEDSKAGKTRITPYWRVVRDDGRLFETIPGGPSAQAVQLEAEGHQIQYSAKLRVIF
jgi:alkylated DNA nucleotide flippase Atl1